MSSPTDAVPADDAPRRRVAPFVALGAAVLAIAMFWVLATASSGSTDASGLVDSHLLGRPAPALETATLDGGRFDLARRKGSWVVLNFFQSTCVPCKAEHPELVAFATQQRAIGLAGAELYTVVQYDDEPDRVRAFFAERGGDWPVLLDENGRVFVSFGVAQVPETFVIDPDGVVRLRWAGPIDAVTLAQVVQQQRDLYDFGAAVGQ
ncbi:MAG: TlpA family protein disulfide reductase [Ilumatobacteraceae bacterium]